MSNIQGAITLRKLCELLGEEFMDAELLVQLTDGHLNVAHVQLPRDLWQMPRTVANADTKEPARLIFQCSLESHRLTKERPRS